MILVNTQLKPAPTTPVVIRSPIALIIILSLASQASGLAWSEMLFNPPGDDNGKEFIELTGNESLDGCTVRDSASSDRLVLLRQGTGQAAGQGTGIILIIESNSTIDIGNATAYTAGSAIGNGLGNAADRITIACNEIALLETAYNISMIDGHKDGQSIIFNGNWMAGPINGTPGIIENSPVGEIPIGNRTSAHDDERERCDDSLLISLNATTGKAGEAVRLTIDSAGYAWFEAAADKLPFASGDTLGGRSHTLILPDARELKITAAAKECGGSQRAVRHITILPRDMLAAAEPPAEAAAGPVPSPPADEPGEEARQEEAPGPDTTNAEPAPAVAATGAAAGEIIDQDRDAVPWIAAFGMVTVIASTTVFLQLLRRGEA